jgi:putative ABC transport system substrate-binding protein
MSANDPKRTSHRTHFGPDWLLFPSVPGGACYPLTSIDCSRVRMRRRDFISILGGVAATWPAVARAQRVYRIGYLSAPSRESVQRTLDAFLRKLRELGWVEGVNLAIEYRWADGDVARLPELAAQLVTQNVDLIVAPNTAATVAAKNATSSIPIVTMFASEPVELKLASSLYQPGGNVTGTSFTAGPGYGGKLLEMIKEGVPAITKVGILSDRADPGGASLTGSLKAAAQALGLQLEWFDVSGPDQLDRTFVGLASHHVDALLITASGTLMPHRKRIAELAIERRLPVIAPIREFAESGSLLTYGVNMSEFVGRSAVYVDKILRGARPGDLPIERPTKLELLVNLRTAKALGISISPAILARADEVIE